jgi:glutathione peroxidase
MILKILMALVLSLSFSLAKGNEMSIYDFKVKDIEGKEISMSKYKDKVLLIVNVASKCGFTNQYEGLEKLFDKYKDKEFIVLGFPSNQFANQEPGTNKQIQEFCTLTFGVKFDMFAKIDVNGDNADPLYVYLKENAPGFAGTEAIKWNFTKFLIDKNGEIVERYGSITTPEEIEPKIVELLK